MRAAELAQLEHDDHDNDLDREQYLDGMDGDVEQVITELHEDLSAEAGGSPWAPVSLEAIAAARADIARIIERERRACSGYAPAGRAADLGDRIEDVWRAMHPGLAAFYDLTAPAGQVRS